VNEVVSHRPKVHAGGSAGLPVREVYLVITSLIGGLQQSIQTFASYAELGFRFFRTDFIRYQLRMVHEYAVTFASRERNVLIHTSKHAAIFVSRSTTCPFFKAVKRSPNRIRFAYADINIRMNVLPSWS
jgi:hypothetical protein